MKKRIITGTVYVVVLIGLLAMKWLVPNGWGSLGFDVLFCAISVLGSIELLRAFKKAPQELQMEVPLAQKAITISFCSAIVPMYAAVEIAMGSGWIAGLALALVYVIVTLIFMFTHFGGSTPKSTLLSLFTMLYCGVLCCVLAALNHIEHSLEGIILLFLVVMLTDAMAYIVGSTLKRWISAPLAESISPNKTVIGGVGGLIGGIAGAIAAYFIYFGFNNIGTLVVDGIMLGAFILVGFITSIAAQAGDLFESYIKRKCKIKDMGNLLPGHGGVLDRFDSMLVSGLIVLLGFIIIYI
ncbi:MAG: phosphatidate cytidylyltransferase [Clostridia bacterium]|nr:phosphatidate cytidylyltransferase [Clostridia bacterium]